MRNPTRERAKGQWKAILPQLGISAERLKNRHGPCPACGGKDPFRFDDKDGQGTFYCNRCGPGDGFKLLELVHGIDFKEAARRVDNLFGHDPGAEKPQPDPAKEEARKRLRHAFKTSWAAQPGDWTDGYLRSRGCDLPPMGLRTHGGLPALDGKTYPTMLAVVSGPDGSAVTMHRTFLNPARPGKAEIDQPRAIMSSGQEIPAGAAIRLFEPGPVLGVAEGIETALKAAHIFQIPVWSTISTSILKKFTPPPETEKLMIFGDNDMNYAGHAAAFELASKTVSWARRNHLAHFEVDVQMAPDPGNDWADY